MTEGERELVAEALMELGKPDGSRTRAMDCLRVALDPDTPTWDGNADE